MARGVADDRTEHIRRQSDDGTWEALTVRHFASSWLIRALVATMPLHVPGAEELLDLEAWWLLAQQTAGIWQWDDGASPLWMNYQGISALREYALLRSAAA